MPKGKPNTLPPVPDHGYPAGAARPELAELEVVAEQKIGYRRVSVGATGVELKINGSLSMPSTPEMRSISSALVVGHVVEKRLRVIRAWCVAPARARRSLAETQPSRSTELFAQVALSWRCDARHNATRGVS